MKAIFMGTPEIAAVILDYILKEGKNEHEIIAVVTQPDRPKGRGGKMMESEVKQVAVAAGIPVYQPEKVKTPEFVSFLRSLEPDIILVAAFGQIMSTEILEIPPYGCINVHASLLPKYRGASPIQSVIIEGEEKTGVTIMYMAKGIDTGDIIMRETVRIDVDETAGSLHDKLAKMSGPLLLRAMTAIKDGTATRTAQNDAESSHTKILEKNIGNIDFSLDATKIERLIRGLNPWPSAFTFLDGKMLKIWKAYISEAGTNMQDAGKIVEINKESFGIATGKGILHVTELQLEGKKRMSAEEFMRGNSIGIGLVLGKE